MRNVLIFTICMVFSFMFGHAAMAAPTQEGNFFYNYSLYGNEGDQLAGSVAHNSMTDDKSAVGKHMFTVLSHQDGCLAAFLAYIPIMITIGGLLKYGDQTQRQDFSSNLFNKFDTWGLKPEDIVIPTFSPLTIESNVKQCGFAIQTDTPDELLKVISLMLLIGTKPLGELCRAALSALGSPKDQFDRWSVTQRFLMLFGDVESYPMIQNCPFFSPIRELSTRMRSFAALTKANIALMDSLNASGNKVLFSGKFADLIRMHIASNIPVGSPPPIARVEVDNEGAVE